MLVLLILSVVIGMIISGVTGIGILGIIAGVFVFVKCLPGALAASFIHGEVSYAQDRADYRQYLSDLASAQTAEEHECAEDDRTNRLVDTIQKNPRQVIHDNRQVHLHAHGRLV
jgi:hypothetical protein